MRHCSSILFSSSRHGPRLALHSFPTRRSSDLGTGTFRISRKERETWLVASSVEDSVQRRSTQRENCYSRLRTRSEEHTSELQSLRHLVCRLLLEKKKKTQDPQTHHRRDEHRHG